MWGNGKLAAVREWADEHGVDLAEQLRLLRQLSTTRRCCRRSAIPFAVNPDPRLRLVRVVAALADRSTSTCRPASRSVLGVEPQQWRWRSRGPSSCPYARFDIAGVEHIPESGSGDHRRQPPQLLRPDWRWAARSPSAGRPVRFLGKKEVFDAPVVGQLAKALGGIRVDRGTGSDEPLHEAAAALDAGELVAIMPQGTIPRGPAFFDPVLKGRWGAARLAAMTRAPVIPVGLWGTEKVWPRSARLPNVLNVTNPPHDPHARRPAGRAQVREPRQGHRADHGGDHDLLPAEAREQREPTAEELRARPIRSGYKGDPTSETTRRPGTD